MTEKADRKLKNSQEIYLTPEQLYVLSLEEDLGRKNRELEEARRYISRLEDELFEESTGVF